MKNTAALMDTDSQKRSPMFHACPFVWTFNRSHPNSVWWRNVNAGKSKPFMKTIDETEAFSVLHLLQKKLKTINQESPKTVSVVV
jgi:hypothetical protein